MSRWRAGSLVTILALGGIACPSAPAELDDPGDPIQDPPHAVDAGNGELGNEPEMDVGDGGSSGFRKTDFEAVCAELQTKVCGAGGECEATPPCASAAVFADIAGERCEAALNDELRYPRCGTSPCTLLVDKVCGDTDAQDARSCEDAAGCTPAQLLDARRTDGSTSMREAESDCQTALSDEVLFAPCSR